MKKMLCLLTAAALCLSLGACGSAKNKEHEFILSLLEQGEYDKAIQVIEILRDGEGGTKPQPAQTAATEAPCHRCHRALRRGGTRFAYSPALRRLDGAAEAGGGYRESLSGKHGRCRSEGI